MAINIRPATEETWPLLEDLFGPSGACYGCWCTHFLLAPKVRQAMPNAERRDLFRSSVFDGPVPGLVALDGEEAVGWVRVTPRDAVPRWNGERTVSRPLDGEDTGERTHWAISCFFIRSRRRGQGISHLLTQAAVDFAVANGAVKLDACPMRKAKQSKSVGLCVGSVSVFQKAGFKIVAERKEGRPLMRLHPT